MSGWLQSIKVGDIIYIREYESNFNNFAYYRVVNGPSIFNSGQINEGRYFNVKHIESNTVLTGAQWSTKQFDIGFIPLGDNGYDSNSSIWEFSGTQPSNVGPGDEGKFWVLSNSNPGTGLYWNYSSVAGGGSQINLLVMNTADETPWSTSSTSSMATWLSRILQGDRVVIRSVDNHSIASYWEARIDTAAWTNNVTKVVGLRWLSYTADTTLTNTVGSNILDGGTRCFISHMPRGPEGPIPSVVSRTALHFGRYLSLNSGDGQQGTYQWCGDQQISGSQVNYPLFGQSAQALSDLVFFHPVDAAGTSNLESKPLYNNINLPFNTQGILSTAHQFPVLYSQPHFYRSPYPGRIVAISVSITPYNPNLYYTNIRNMPIFCGVGTPNSTSSSGNFRFQLTGSLITTNSPPTGPTALTGYHQMITNPENYGTWVYSNPSNPSGNYQVKFKAGDVIVAGIGYGSLGNSAQAYPSSYTNQSTGATNHPPAQITLFVEFDG